MLLGLVLCGLLASTALHSQRASALSGSQFNPANIIDYGVFFNPGSLNAGDVQNFLSAKVPTCDNNGTQSISYYYNSSTGRVKDSRDSWVTTSRATYGQRYDNWLASQGLPTLGATAPYTCLKDYSQDVPSVGPDTYCNGSIAGAHKSAAQIIFDVSQACGISPKVLIVLLQKEQGLVTDDWPWNVQYQKATGYYCPDDPNNPGWCDPAYAGFFNQVYNAAHQFQRYTKQPQNFNFAAGRTSNIQYNPNSACGSSPVAIQNSSTAALYNYTPYQPNAAALSGLSDTNPGGGDNCSAYGNRNFWWYFNRWFGSTQTNIPYAWTMNAFQIYRNPERTQSFPNDTTVAPGGKVYIRIIATNVGNQTWDPSFLRLGTYRPAQRTSQFVDPSWYNPFRPAQLMESSVSPGQTGTFEFALTAPQTTGTYQEYYNLVAEDRAWLNEQGSNFTINVVSPIPEPTNTNKNILGSGEKLYPSEYLLSSEGKSVLTLQTDGNLVLYDDFKATWNTVSFGKTPDHLEMGTDGNLVLFFKDGTNWQTNTPTHPGAYLKLQSDGNLVLYDSSNVAYWNSVTFQTPDNLSYVNTTLRSATMFQGQQLETADRRFRLAFQQDGNLVLYSPNRALWSANTHGKGAKRVTLQADGNLVVYDGSGRAIWNTLTFGNGPSQLVVQQDGNLVLYNGSGRATWNTATFGQQ